MFTTLDLIEAAKTAQAIPSNYRLARVLEVPEGTVQRWNTGRNLPDDAACFRLAELAHLDPGFVVASIRAERAKDAAESMTWRKIAARLQAAGSAAAVVILSAGLLGVSFTPDAQARTPSPAQNRDSASSVYYVNRRIWRAVLQWFTGRSAGPLMA